MKTEIFSFFIFLSLICLGNTFVLKPSFQTYNQIKASSFNYTLSKDYAILAIASYCDKKCIENWDCQVTTNYLKNDKVINISHAMGTLTRAAGFVAFDQTKNLIVVSLRGSSNIQNWVQNFNFDMIPYSKCKECKVHNGFMEDYDSIQNKIHQSFDKLVKAYPNAEVLVTGHSLGAALSVLFGLQFKLKYPTRIIEVHNVGCPRVGNPSFAQFAQSKIDRLNRVVHNRDLVPHLPPTNFGYHHEAYEIFLDQSCTNYTICNQSGQDNTCSNKYFPDYSINDHDFYYYDFNKIFKC